MFIIGCGSPGDTTNGESINIRYYSGGKLIEEFKGVKDFTDNHLGQVCFKDSNGNEICLKGDFVINIR